MHLTDLRINAFGSVRDVTFDRLDRGMTGIYGANGSGKTTVLQFLRGALGDRSSAFWNHSHTTASGHIEVQSRNGRRDIPIHGDSGTAVLSDAKNRTGALAQLATVTASEAYNTDHVEQLARELGVSLDTNAVDLTKEREAHASLVAERNTLTANPGGAVPQAEDELNRIEAALSAARAEQARTSDRLASQAQALRAAIVATQHQVNQTHADYQASQSDLTEWQTDAWRPRRRTVEVEEYEVEVADDPVVDHQGTDLRTALLEIAQLRCKASARRADAAAGGPLDLCGNTLNAPLQIADELRESLGRLRTAAGTVPAAGLAARVDDLIISLEQQQRAADWLDADRTRMLLDRCERDLEHAALRKCSVCAQGTNACQTNTCRTETQSRTTEIVEPPADAALGLRLREAEDDAYARWQSALARHRQARRQLDQFDLEITRAADDGRITRLIAERDAASKHLHDLRMQVESLNEAIAALETILAEDRAPSGPLVDAGDYFRRLTCGHYSGLVRAQSGRSELRAMTAAGQSIALDELSRGTKAQAALAMRLAVFDALSEEGINPPLILDDVLVDSDKDRATAAVTLLKDWSRHRQTLLITCQRQLIDAMKANDVPMRTLGSKTVSEEPRRATIVADTVVNPSPSTVQIVASRAVGDTPAKVLPIVTAAVKGADDDQKDTYWLDPDSMIVRVPSISETDARRLNSLGIESVEHLVLVTPDEVEADLIELQINPRSFTRWQSEARLLTLVPGLVGRDAQLLAWVEIRDPEQLAAIDLETLRTRLRNLSSNSSAGALRSDTETYSTDRLDRWRSRARRSRSSRSLFRSRPTIRSVRESRRERRRGTDHRDTTRRRADQGTTTTGRSDSNRARTLSVVERRRALRRESQSRGDSSSEPKRSSSTVTSAMTSTTSARKASDKQHQEKSTEWRHYLDADSPVVDAPSIGPKMARRLGKQRIKTVTDLLKADAAKVARELDDRRIKKQTVIDWQDQARLMCCIPMLRGHDVQVLVACDYRTVDKVSATSPNAMFSIVGPFVKTKEGERMLRSSKVPDLEEVTDWINYARHPRALKAA